MPSDACLLSVLVLVAVLGAAAWLDHRAITEGTGQAPGGYVVGGFCAAVFLALTIGFALEPAVTLFGGLFYGCLGGSLFAGPLVMLYLIIYRWHPSQLRPPGGQEEK